MTEREKRERKKMRDQLRKDGILPPPKKRLDRKKYAREIIIRYKDERYRHFDFTAHVDIAIGCMIPDDNVLLGVTPEQLGVLKMLHMAMDMYDLMHRPDGIERKEMTVGEVYEKVIKPILEL